MDSSQSPKDLLVESLKPVWTPNDMIKMFHEEREKIEQRGRDCKSVLAETDAFLERAMLIKDLHSTISPKTSQLYSECKNIIQERNKLRESFDTIKYTLSKQEELRGILKRVPEIKEQAAGILRNVLKKFSTETSSTTSTDILDDYYGKFLIECRRIKELTGQLESCLACPSSDNLIIDLEEIYTTYLNIRDQLMLPVYTRYLGNLLKKSNGNYCDLLRQACASLVRLMRNEKQLFEQIFPTQSIQQASQKSRPLPTSGEQSSSLTKERADSVSSLPPPDNLQETMNIKRRVLKELLEIYCNAFYEHLRPVVIHVNHLEILSELYTMLNALKLDLADASYQSTLNMLAEDIQERMTFRTEVFIAESISGYQPSQGDLAYPEKFSLLPNGELNNYQSMWYPTVQRTVLALLHLHRVFDTMTFHELARDLVAACYKSLDDAQRLIDERHGGNKLEASVFLSKHSAIIVNQLQTYGIDHSQLPPPVPLLADDEGQQHQRAQPQRPRAPPAAAAAAAASRGEGSSSSQSNSNSNQ